MKRPRLSFRSRKETEPKQRKKTTGLPPGAIVFTGERKLDKVLIHQLQYDPDGHKDNELTSEGTINFPPLDSDKVDWYDFRGLHDHQLIAQIGEHFQLHPLVLEDIPDVLQRPKFEEYPEGIFIIVKALSFNAERHRIEQEHVAIFVAAGLVLSFQETESDLFSSVRQRISQAFGRVRRKGEDYLAYALLDVITDNYFLVLEDIGDRIEELEDKLLAAQDPQDKALIHHLKKELLRMRKAISPLREAVGRFYKSESPLIEDATNIFLQDLYDHSIQIMDMVESYRDTLNSLQDLFVSEVSLKMNQVMQLLTIVSTIFIPLSFLTGLYGMNFTYIPELEYRYGYFVLIGVMSLIFLCLLRYFQRKRWL